MPVYHQLNKSQIKPICSHCHHPGQRSRWWISWRPHPVFRRHHVCLWRSSVAWGTFTTPLLHTPMRHIKKEHVESENEFLSERVSYRKTWWLAQAEMTKIGPEDVFPFPHLTPLTKYRVRDKSSSKETKKIHFLCTYNLICRKFIDFTRVIIFSLIVHLKWEIKLLQVSISHRLSEIHRLFSLLSFFPIYNWV